MSDTIIADVEELLEPILFERELVLDKVEYIREGKNNILRVSIDKEGGVDLNECTIVSELLSEKLDETDPIKGMYLLDISSPGAEKPLTTKDDFVQAVSKNIYVSLYVHIDGNKEYEGMLQEFANDTATIEYKYKHTKKQVKIPFDKIAKARLSVML